MEFRIIFKVIPVPIFYVKNLGWAAGRSYGFFVCIKKGYENDRGLLEHELQHCRQFYRLPILFPVLYWLSESWRYKAELECFRIQLGYSKDKTRSAKFFTKLLLTRYGLNQLNLKSTRVHADLTRK